MNRFKPQNLLEELSVSQKCSYLLAAQSQHHNITTSQHSWKHFGPCVSNQSAVLKVTSRCTIPVKRHDVKSKYITARLCYRLFFQLCPTVMLCSTDVLCSRVPPGTMWCFAAHLYLMTLCGALQHTCASWHHVVLLCLMALCGALQHTYA